MKKVIKKKNKRNPRRKLCAVCKKEIEWKNETPGFSPNIHFCSSNCANRLNKK